MMDNSVTNNPYKDKNEIYSFIRRVMKSRRRKSECKYPWPKIRIDQDDSSENPNNIFKFTEPFDMKYLDHSSTNTRNNNSTGRSYSIDLKPVTKFSLFNDEKVQNFNKSPEKVNVLNH